MKNETVDFYLTRKHSTENAILFTDGAEDYWIPKSLIEDMNQVGSQRDDFEVLIPEWFAKKQGMI